MPALCLPTEPGGMGASPCCLPFPQTLKRRGVGLDGPELEPDEGRLISAVFHTDDSTFPVHPSVGRTDKEVEIQ